MSYGNCRAMGKSYPLRGCLWTAGNRRASTAVTPLAPHLPTDKTDLPTALGQLLRSCPQFPQLRRDHLHGNLLPFCRKEDWPLTPSYAIWILASSPGVMFLKTLGS
jgi:hypothetical protein